MEDGAEVARTVGWLRPSWEELTGVTGLGADLPEQRPGCGSLSVDPDMVDVLAVRFGGSVLRSRRVEIAALEDEAEALFDRGWTDGLPVVAPTEARVLRMLEGTTRAPDEIVAIVPPDLVECTVEKVAINAVMAGAKPEYMPVVLAALEAACTDEFNIHGVLATTMPVGPVLIVNGPIRKAIGMNSGGNVLGQGNRANLAIGRALQLVIRNVGGGRPGGVDRAAHGNPGKLSFCFAEDEEGSPWESLAVERGFAPDASTRDSVPRRGPAVRGRSARRASPSRSLARSPRAFARCSTRSCRSASTPSWCSAPSTRRVFKEAGWSKQQVKDAIMSHLQLAGSEIVRGADGIAEGIPEHLRDLTLPKFRPGGLLLVHAGGGAGLFSAIIGGWANGETGSQPTTRLIG